jgi:DNA invertase Pin-like site-specific DNA recombinase
VAALDRVGRNVKNLLLLLDELHALGITFVSLREGIDFGTPIGKMIMTTLAAIAELERETIRIRIRESLAAKKIQAEQTGNGWRCGRPIVVTEEVMHQVMLLHSQGLSVRAIERAMGRKVSHSTIAKIIKNRRSAK